MKNNKNILLIFILIGLFMAISDIIITRINTKKDNNLNTKKQESITIISISSKAEQIAHLATQAACDKHLPASIYGLNLNRSCQLDLMAIAKQENRDYSYNTSGSDSYLSSGLFQISRYYHPEITLSQQNDPFFSADWTLARLINNGYLTNRDNAIRLHNGSLTNYKTAHYLAGVNANREALNNNINIINLN